jgi:hypothetical protein
MDFGEYRKIDAVNWSTLKEARRSLKHYRHRLTEEREDTPRLAMGRATHTAVFESDRFMLDYALFTGARRAGKDWDECCRANKGKTILKSEEYATCLAMRDAVRAHPVAGPALTPPGEAEKTLTWTDERTGIACKARLDWWRPGLLADLKTTADVDVERFGATSYRMGYHGQMAFYRAGLAANGLDAPPPWIIAVEAAAPHDVAVLELDDDALYAGERMVAELLSLVAAGRFSNLWPGRYPEKRPLSLPRWAAVEDDVGDLLGITVEGETA